LSPIKELFLRYEELSLCLDAAQGRALFSDTYRTLILNIDQLSTFDFDQLQIIQHKAKSVFRSLKEDANLKISYVQLKHLLKSLAILRTLSGRLSKVLQEPHPNFYKIGKQLKQFWFCVLLIAKSKDLLKINITKAFLNFPRYQNEIIADFFLRNFEFALTKKIFPQAFNVYWQAILNKLQALSNCSGDEENYTSAIFSFTIIYPLINETERSSVHEMLFNLLSSPCITPRIFLQLFPFLPKERQLKLIEFKANQFKQEFLESVEKGELGFLHHCLTHLLFAPYRNFVIFQISHAKELENYLPFILSIQNPQQLQKACTSILELNFQTRFSYFEKIEQKTPLVSKFLARLVSLPEKSLKIRYLHLLEQVEPSKIDPLLSLLNTFEKLDFIGAESLLNSLDIEVWDPLPNEDTLLGIATQIAVLQQENAQKLSNNSFVPRLKQTAEQFLFFLHTWIKNKLNKKYSSLVYQKSIEMIAISAFRTNEVFSKNNLLFFGKWDNPTDIYERLISIYLPADELNAWKNYVLEMGESSNHVLLNRLMRIAFQGSQKSYGLWFHLCAKAALEAIKDGIGWQEVLQMLGDNRRLAALFMVNVQITKDKYVSLATRMQQFQINKEWPGSPLNFGVRNAFEVESYTTLTMFLRTIYIQKVKNIFAEFEDYFSLSKQSFKEVQVFERNGRELTIYPLSNTKHAFALTFPIQINGERVTGTHILWNWPKKTTFFYPGHPPVRPKYPHEGLWIHATGSDKQKIEREVAILFNLLIQPKIERVLFEKNLARFIFLFSQAIPFYRGAAAVGLILINLLLLNQGRSLPLAPPPLYFLDCEAMIQPENEFTKGFIEWINGGPFFVDHSN
jgi:hypothetical protein